MIRCRGIKFADEDDAYDYFRQREVDEAEEALLQQQHEHHQLLTTGEEHAPQDPESK